VESAPAPCHRYRHRTVTSTAADVLLLTAGVLAGAVGSVGGITSLIWYPAPLAIGIPLLPANVTQSVAFVTCLRGSYRSCGVRIHSAAAPTALLAVAKESPRTWTSPMLSRQPEERESRWRRRRLR
jgi:hypothetical protein